MYQVGFFPTLSETNSSHLKIGRAIGAKMFVSGRVAGAFPTGGDLRQTFPLDLCWFNDVFTRNSSCVPFLHGRELCLVGFFRSEELLKTKHAQKLLVNDGGFTIQKNHYHQFILKF